MPGIIAACHLAAAQDSEISFTRGTAGTWNIEWEGKEDRTDFVQWSLDLEDWHFLPVVEHGPGLKSYGCFSSTDKFFVRLEHAFVSTSSPEGSDYDGDGLSNAGEVTLHDTHPLKWDTDDDGMSDAWEIWNNLDPRDDGSIDFDGGPNGDRDSDGLVNRLECLYSADPHLSDTDGDGLSDGAEVLTHKTSPVNDDTDWDDLKDGDEITLHGTDPGLRDTDEDSLSDGDEILTHGTDPTLPDTDGDRMPDGWELDVGFDPLDDADGQLDADSDSLANNLEYVFMAQGYDPFSPNPAAGFPWNADLDHDNLTNAQEFNLHRTDPHLRDTDGDRIPDGWEVLHDTGPLLPSGDADPDQDGLLNLDEYLNSTDPNNPDSDGDGVPDGDEVDSGANPNNPDDDGTVPPEKIVPVGFAVYGDYASWEMLIEPLGASGQQAVKVTTPEVGVPGLKVVKLHKGVKYKITLSHTGSKNVAGAPWYCWGAQADGKPAEFTFENYTSARLPGVAEFFTVGSGNWLVDNRSGLLTNHIHENSVQGAGNVTAEREAILHPIEIVDKDKNPLLTELKVGKMYPGVVSGMVPVDHPSVNLDADADRFFVRVKDGGSLGTIKMKFETTDNPDAGYDDDPTEYTLVSEDGHAITKSMLLVSDDVDDNHEEFVIGGKADNQLDDRTHKIQLKGYFKIHSIRPPINAIPSAEGWEEMDYKLPVKVKKTVKVQFVNCKYAFSSDCWDNGKIDQEKIHLKERFAQIGIDFIFDVVPGPHIGAYGSFTSGEYPYLNASRRMVYPEEFRDMVYSGPSNDFNNTLMIYLIRYIDAPGTNYFAGIGCPDVFTDAADKEFRYKVLLAHDDAKDFTCSHEAFHVLGDAAHDVPIDFATEYADEFTIWTVPSTDVNIRRNNSSVGSTKRFSEAQEAKMRSHPLAK
ncbi:hypothetical protein [Luteolibacter sp. Populi]|uniref:hypothetical protein n=1 Tax=Luteolibacter sp. Populi TaxID=3230487 RepID=UPI0034669A10